MTVSARLTLKLPARGGQLIDYTPGPATTFAPPEAAIQSRVAFAAAHVVCDPLADNRASPVDWEATLAFRRHLWSLGLGVAEAMDTAQRGMGLSYRTMRELVERSTAEAKAVGGRVVCGAATDQLPAGATTTPTVTLDEIIAAYEEQCAFIEACGGRVVLMASRHLAATATGPDDYVRVYSHLLGQVREPVVLHWLGDMFDPALTGYWGSTNLDEATETCLAIIQTHADKVDGIKMSLLDAEREVALRRRLPAGVKMYSGDDFNYDVLIRGDDKGYSHALLGIFDAIAPAASAALQALDQGDVASYQRVMEPTIPLSRHIFQTPTYFYKTGIVFLAYLNGHQDHFRMLGGFESARSITHLAELFVLADKAGLLRDPELATGRMRLTLALAGVS